MSKSTGPVSGRGGAQNPGRRGTYGKTVSGAAQPAPAKGKPDGVNRTGEKDPGARTFTPRRGPKANIG